MRKTIGKITVAASLALLSPLLLADHGTTYTCTMDGTNDRIIKVEYKNEGATVPCEVTYTKDGETKSLWRYENTQGECEKHAEAFAEKQRAWGMTCSTGSAPVMMEDAPAAAEATAQ